jgi:hypothetical protein
MKGSSPNYALYIHVTYDSSKSCEIVYLNYFIFDIHLSVLYSPLSTVLALSAVFQVNPLPFFNLVI